MRSRQFKLGKKLLFTKTSMHGYHGVCPTAASVQDPNVLQLRGGGVRPSLLCSRCADVHRHKCHASILPEPIHV